MNNILWPSVDNLWSAKKACAQASSVALLVGVVTGIVTFMHFRVVNMLEGISEGSVIDTVLFLGLTVLIYRCSRIASATALLAYAYGQVLIVQQTHRAPTTGVFFCLLFIGGVRGAFAYHEMKNGMSAEEVRTALKALREEAAPRPSLTKRIIAWVVLIALAVGGYLWYRNVSKHPSTARMVVRKAAPSPRPSPAKQNKRMQVKMPPLPKFTPKEATPQPGQQTFKLKDGSAVTGRVIKNDPVYYAVEISGGKQAIVFKEDLKETPG